MMMVTHGLHQLDHLIRIHGVSMMYWAMFENGLRIGMTKRITRRGLRGVSEIQVVHRMETTEFGVVDHGTIHQNP